MPALMPSELPVVARARHHWIVLFSRPSKPLLVGLAVLLVAAAIRPMPMAWLFCIAVTAALYLRVQAWRAETVLLTRLRIIRLRGIPETTSSEASLRIDRVSGAVLEQTVLGKLLNFGTIELEAPGQHPDVRVLERIAHPHRFYLHVRRAVFDGAGTQPPAADGGPGPGAPGLGVPDTPDPGTRITEPLPFLPDRLRRRW